MLSFVASVKFVKQWCKQMDLHHVCPGFGWK